MISGTADVTCRCFGLGLNRLRVKPAAPCPGSATAIYWESTAEKAALRNVAFISLRLRQG